MEAVKSWGHFYEKAAGVQYFLEHLAIHKEFIDKIISMKPTSILETGCGSGIMSVFFAMAGLKATACDLDHGVLEKAAQNASDWCAKVAFSHQDILRMTFKEQEFDLSFSQGVLEHMNDTQIQAACVESLRVSQRFIFSVPSQHYKHKDFGNERLLSDRQWKKIIGSVAGIEVLPYYAVRTKKNFLMKQPLMWMGVVSR